jgi:hypothetical protein
VAMRSDGVGGAALVVLGHLKTPASLLPCLRQADLGERRAVMQYDGEGMSAPFLVVPLPLFSPDQEGRHNGAALHPSSLMVEFRVPAVDSLRRRIRDPQVGSSGAKVGEPATWCVWCLCVGSRSGGGGRLSLSPLLCVGIPHGGGDKVFRSLAVRQPAVVDGLSSPVRIKMEADARSTPMIRFRDGAGREILRLLQCLTSLVKDGGGLGGSPAGWRRI